MKINLVEHNNNSPIISKIIFMLNMHVTHTLFVVTLNMLFHHGVSFQINHHCTYHHTQNPYDFKILHIVLILIHNDVHDTLHCLCSPPFHPR